MGKSVLMCGHVVDETETAFAWCGTCADFIRRIHNGMFHLGYTVGDFIREHCPF